jgi:ligand-binding SRPBCC domain-containing protein
LATHEIRAAQWLPARLPDVFRFFANPRNLPRIMPDVLQARLEDLKLVRAEEMPEDDSSWAAGVGSEILLSFRLIPYLPPRARWLARIVEFEWNSYFVDVQARGLFRSVRHRHAFREESRNGRDGTTIEDAVEYDVGFGAAGAVADFLVIRRVFQRTFDYRHRAVERLFATAQFPASCG